MAQVNLYNGQPYTNLEQLDKLRAKDIKVAEDRAKAKAQGADNIKKSVADSAATKKAEAVKKAQAEVEVKKAEDAKQDTEASK